MEIVSTLLTVAALAGPPVEVSTFAGGEHKGELTALKDGQLTMSIEGQEADLRSWGTFWICDWAPRKPLPSAESPVMVLTDGTRLTCQKVTSTQEGFSIETGLGAMKIPANAVGSVRLAPQLNAVAEAWEQLAERQLNDDMLVIKKGNLLDNLKGVVGEISG